MNTLDERSVPSFNLDASIFGDDSAVFGDHAKPPHGAPHGLDVSVLAKDITAALDRLPRGATAISNISDNIDTAVQEGWIYGSLMYGDLAVRTGYVLLGMLKRSVLRNALFAISRQFERIKADDLSDRLPELLKGFDFLIAVIGLFGIGEILLSMEEGLEFQGKAAKINPKVVWETWKELPRY